LVKRFGSRSSDFTEARTFIMGFERRRDWEPGADRERTVVVNVAP
jgi:hypothetical protein